jgi:energy-coupling factor transporter ATP-binding protein EcfA2
MTVRKKWLSILNWMRLPRFGKIHNLENEIFSANYYIPPSIDEVLANFMFSLSQESSRIDKLISGKPGCGKTTFLYYLKEVILQEHGILDEKYVLEIIHFLRFIRSDGVTSITSIETWMKDLYANYLRECGFQNEVEGILRNKDFSDINSKINALINLLKRERNNCSKQLIICIDDIDEAPKDQVEPVLRNLYSYMETSVIEKWITIRGITLDHYPLSLSLFIRRKFPEKINFPRADFHGILDRRITAVGENPKNPFGKEICSQIIQVFDEDIRETLGGILGFLELNPPVSLNKDTSTDLIGRYYGKNIGRVLINMRVFPNIFLKSHSSRLPIEKDIFVLIDFKHTIDGEFRMIIDSYYKETIEVIDRENRVRDKKWIAISEKELKGSIKYLIDNHLIEELSSDCYLLTGRGRIFKRYIFSKEYQNYCLKEVVQYGEQKVFPFWDLAKIDPSFGEDVSYYGMRGVLKVK